VASKYRSVRTSLDLPGIGSRTFDSKKESVRGFELALLYKSGEITSLEFQPRFDLIVNDVKICTYVADFKYSEKGRTIIEDTKGMKTDVYRLKKRLMKAIYDIDIFES